jgi:hypothetical protein
MATCPRNHIYRTLEQSLVSRRFPAARSGAFIATQADYRGNLPNQPDLKAALAIRRGVQHDALDERDGPDAIIEPVAELVSDTRSGTRLLI